MWYLHVGNTFEQDSGSGGLDLHLHMSSCSYDWFDFHRMFGYNWKKKKLDPSFMRAVKAKELLHCLVQVAVELDKRGVARRRCAVKRLSDQWNRPVDFPAINPSYANKRNRSARWWSSEGRKFVGEPLFIPTGGGEDHGYVILVEYVVSKDRCHLVVLDARKIEKRGALVAKLELPKHLTLPMGFHGFSADE